MPAIARTFLVFALAVWLGGLTFYAGVVIPVGSDVLGGHRAFGFVTREVTPWLNGIGAGVILVLLVDLWCRRGSSQARWWTWGAMAIGQATLFVLHPWLDSLLDPTVHAIREPSTFYGRHRAYLWVTALQWLGAVGHLHLLLRRP